MAPPKPPGSSAPQRPLGIVLALLGRGVLTFHPSLVSLCGGVTSALILGQALYWTRVLAKRDGDRDGWFWKTHDEWTLETSLTRHEQVTARARLARTRFWTEERRGMPARLWYRVDLDELARAIDSSFVGCWDWNNQDLLFHLLGKPLVLYRSLADACGSVTSAILLSRLLQHLRSAERQAALAATRTTQFIADSWQPLVPTTLMAQTGLSRSEFYHARAALRAARFAEDRLVGTPPRAEWRLIFNPLISALTSDVPAQDTPETPVVAQLYGFQTTSCTDSVHKNAAFHKQECGFQHSRNPESVQQGILNAHNKPAGIQTTSCTDSGFPYKQLTTKAVITSLTPPPPPSLGAQEADFGTADKGVVDSVTLVWPTKGLLPAEITAGLALLRPVMPQAQLLIDELAGQMAKGLVRQPLPYLRRLVIQAQEGRFVPLVASRVAAQRQRAAAIAASVGTTGHTDVPTLSDAQKANRCAELQSLRRSLSTPPELPLPPSRSADR